MKKPKHREVWQCGKYKAGYRAFWDDKPFNPNASFAWQTGWNKAQFERDCNHEVWLSIGRNGKG